MRREQVKIKIKKSDGTVKVEADGFVGEGCNALNDMEMALGTRQSYETKDEAYQYQLPDVVPVGQAL